MPVSQTRLNVAGHCCQLMLFGPVMGLLILGLGLWLCGAYSHVGMRTFYPRTRGTVILTHIEEYYDNLVRDRRDRRYRVKVHYEYTVDYTVDGQRYEGDTRNLWSDSVRSVARARAVAADYPGGGAGHSVP